MNSQSYDLQHHYYSCHWRDLLPKVVEHHVLFMFRIQIYFEMLSLDIVLLSFFRAMQRKLEEQTKTIQFIKTKYKEKTGEEIVMPKGWEDYLCLEKD